MTQLTRRGYCGGLPGKRGDEWNSRCEAAEGSTHGCANTRLIDDEGQAAATSDASRDDLKGTTYELFILAISILSIVNLVLLFIFEFRSSYWWLVAMADIVLTLIFVFDFGYRLRTAPSKRRYLGRGGGVFDLLGCLAGPRIFRLFRIVRAIRIIRRLGGRRMLRDVRSQLASGTLYLIVFLGLTTLEVVGLLELYFEQDAPGGNITTGGDALWWGYVTATTVGYGDYYPVTTGGRIAGTLMLTVGVALFLRPSPASSPTRSSPAIATSQPHPQTQTCGPRCRKLNACSRSSSGRPNDCGHDCSTSKNLNEVAQARTEYL